MSCTSVPSYATLTLRFMKCRDKCIFYSFVVTDNCIHLRLAKQKFSGLCDAFRVRELLAKYVFMCRECFHPECVKAVGSDWK